MSYLICCRYVVVPFSDVVLPPLSSKVVKFVVDVRGGRVGELSRSSMPFKPLSISPLFLDGSPLISFRVSGPPLSVRGGTLLTTYVSVVFNDYGLVDELTSLEGVYDTPYGRFRFNVDALEVVDVRALSLGLTKFFRVDFITPTILTSKYMLPPTLKSRSKSLPEKHRLVPQPSLIFSYLLRLWNSIVSPEEKIPNTCASDWEAYKLGRLSDIALVEVNYRLRPTSVVIGKDSKGRLRIAKGFKGWVTYECLSSKLLQVYDKLLALATYLGIGRSRGIGLGLIKVKTYNTKTNDSS
jgi:CRISPR-associated endoribonuclease Cas6